MYYAAPQQSAPTRVGGITAVLALNALVVVGLVFGLKGQALKQVIDPIITEVIEEAPPPPDEPPPPPPPELAAPEPPKIPIPEIEFDEPPPPAPTAIQAVESGEPTTAPSAAVIKPRLARRNVLPDYPEASRRAGEQGETLLEVCVDPNGRATSVTLKSSSGHDRLDRAAISWLERQRYQAGSVSGNTQADCYTQSIVWELPK